jgi:hypothetical protein
LILCTFVIALRDFLGSEPLGLDVLDISSDNLLEPISLYVSADSFLRLDALPISSDAGGQDTLFSDSKILTIGYFFSLLDIWFVLGTLSISTEAEFAFMIDRLGTFSLHVGFTFTDSTDANGKDSLDVNIFKSEVLFANLRLGALSRTALVMFELSSVSSKVALIL